MFLNCHDGFRMSLGWVQLKSLGYGGVRALSAGTRPQPKVADGAIEALRLAGLPTDGLHPKDVDAALGLLRVGLASF